ncbi:hypothetical protein OEM_20110 [Mycobacterium intracellulare subsp. yongonense 05-1390]|uniref:hypothetical protein n=1 Tax=Mycobacterium TaxID=1763 RepID=UPI00025D574C|nr:MULTISPECIES: hypothetical protein [Mycobacterium]AFJ35061.1 hypothetical protein W7S_10450 [Mycobacterium sp. MOTT36Y]AGP63546.1 hypothetical protein OEM_20110 [Mycobacterium intracellulare subsp. yongonense 05-1390]ELR84804.1 hypothetical protein W7U_06220 [Mycobacterium sp. H4Y]PBA55285.1 hypothetical protein CKJ57_11540 [Mycobacterium intracellulare subsp. chimaera]
MRAALTAVAVAVAVWLGCPAAHADPAPPPPTPTPPGYVQCNGQLIPADPRLDVQNPVGAAMYRFFLQQMCAAPPPAPPG